MAFHYKWSIAEMSDMVPWEFDYYIEQVRVFVKKQREARDSKQ